jgi:chemotaxis protein CheD
MPLCLPQFSRIQRYVDHKLNVDAVVKLKPGEYYVGYNNELITTVLGSCISVCVYDEQTPIGGMNHFMLPDENNQGAADKTASRSTRYGSFAMEQLINDMLCNGAKRKRLKFKLFGGSDMMGGLSTIGKQNIQFVKDFLTTEGYRWCAEDLGNCYPRWVRFHPLTGAAQIKYLPVSEVQNIANEEQRAKASASNVADNSGDLELF